MIKGKLWQKGHWLFLWWFLGFFLWVGWQIQWVLPLQTQGQTDF